MRVTLAVIFGVAGFIAGLGVYRYHGPPIGAGWGVVPVGATVASVLLAVVLWRPVTCSRPTAVRGGLAGALVALLAYPVAWYILIVSYWLFTIGSPEHRRVIPPWTAVPASLVYGFVGLIFTGWFTVPIGAVAGIITIFVQRRRASVVNGTASSLRSEEHPRT